ncbi:hypothetical protein ACFQ0T_09160 [Kitasatospora gansuensis]
MLFARKALVTASIAMSAVVGALATASPASASISTGSYGVEDCDAQCVVLYFNTGYGGSHTVIHSDTPTGGEGIRDLAGYTFQSGGAGQGQSLKNNAASAKARVWGIDASVTVYFNSGYAGPATSSTTPSTRPPGSSRTRTTRTPRCTSGTFRSTRAASTSVELSREFVAAAFPRGRHIPCGEVDDCGKTGIADRGITRSCDGRGRAHGDGLLFGKRRGPHRR